jgi:hypothetical protein
MYSNRHQEHFHEEKTLDSYQHALTGGGEGLAKKTFVFQAIRGNQKAGLNLLTGKTLLSGAGYAQFGVVFHKCHIWIEVG